MKAAFFDVDGTLTDSRVWRGLMEYFAQRGDRRLTHAAFWAYHMPLFLLYRLGLISQSGFRRPWAQHLPWFFRGYGVEAAREIWDWAAETYLAPHWRPDIRALLEDHAGKGDLVMLVSGGPTPLVARIAEELGAAMAVGSDPEVKDGIYTGRTSGRVCIGAEKPRLAKAALEDKGVRVDWEASYAYADSPGDIPLLEMVGNPVATYPDEELLPIAQARGWRILPGGR